MTNMNSEVYDAFISAGVDDKKARAAAESVANYDLRFSRVDTDLAVLKWMGGVTITMCLGLLWRAFS